MERVYCRDFATFYSKLSRLRVGGLAGAETKIVMLSFGFLHLDIDSRAIVGSAKGGRVVDLRPEIYLSPGILPFLDPWLRWVNAVQASLNDWSAGGRGRRLAYSVWKLCNDVGWWGRPAEELLEASISSYAVVVSAVVLLSLVYQYLTGNVDPGSSKAYSRSSLDFRDIYVAVVLFLGAYVWIKFREVAFRGVHKRVVKRGRIAKVVYDARLTPPIWNGKAVPKLDLGQFATPQEAHNKFLIAAFYYNRGAGLLDGWFQVPPMSEEERSLTGLELREWVIGQAKKVYEDFKKKEVEFALLPQELLEDEVTPEQDEVNVDFSWASLLNFVEDQQPALVSQVENLGMDMAMLDGQGFDCASQALDGMHEGFVTTDGLSLGFEEESAISMSQLTSNTQSGLGINNSNQLNLLQIIVQNQQELITNQQQQLQELVAQISLLQNEQRIQQQQLEESRIRIYRLESQHFVQQQLQVINEGVPSLEVEMEQRMPHQNHPCRPHGSAFW